LRILITGGTGSLGHALVRHYLSTTDHRLIVFSRDELKQAQMREEFPDGRLDFFLGDVRDLPRLELACAAAPDVVVHAAALKRVDAVCDDPDEVLKTNILGTRNVLHAARGRVPKCLLISTDKACYPTTVYGASKLTAEILSTTFNAYSFPHGTISASVRYGNVLNSRGSAGP
jgi:UDP-N-acetylglucosamine 4,6-dehydratase